MYQLTKISSLYNIGVLYVTQIFDGHLELNNEPPQKKNCILFYRCKTP